MITFLDLPWEDVICRRIFSYLSVSEICRLRFVSQQYLLLVETYFMVCRVLDLSSCGRKSSFTASSFESLTNSCETLREVKLSGCKRWLNDRLLIPVLESNVCLSSIDLTGSLDVTDESIKVLAVNCRFLQELVLAECRWLTSNALLVVGLECMYLKVLVLRGCWNIDNESLSTVVQNNKSLVVIDVGSCYSINGVTVSIMAKHCPELRHIDLCGCWRVDNDAIFTIKEYCKDLQSLMIKDCRDVNEKSLGILRATGVAIDVPKPPEYLRPLVPMDIGGMYVREPFLNLQV